ncbi:sugar ABC transporter substrate-binding protein [Fictibacillus enclensis]|uniref:ABC transporter substrate-binding protein n=1 Tax=Fictibacillus enclensis TaxID=1017270 RepID=UPI0025A175D9|nr:sugar ABC transporter substrate-binding protein [Fictibacillus enclensis]MDM5200944.1 sugar ABC transporter substrate-binding protein [Fictibacillus enclensis]
MKRKVSCVLAVLLVISLLSGCSVNTASGPVKSKTTTLTYWTFNGLHEALFQDAATKWNELHPDRKIKLNSVVYPYGQMHDNLSISLIANQGVPDLVDIEQKRFATMIKGKNVPLVDLTSLVAKDRDKFVESRLTMYSKNGKLYGIGTHVGTTVMYYNMDIMKKAGVDIDQIQTWEDYVNAGKQVRQKTGKPMTTIETKDPNNFLPMIVQQKSGFFNKNGKLILNNKINVKTLEFLRDMVYKDKVAIPTPGGNHHAEEYYGFMNQGGAGSVMMPIWYMGRFLDYMPDLKGKIAIRPMPAWTKGGDRSAGMGGTATSIPKASKHIELAKDFLQYTKASKEGNIKLWTVLGFDPLRWDVWDDPALRKKNKYTGYFTNGTRLFDMLLELKDEINPLYMTKDFPAVSDKLATQILYKTIKLKSESPKKALDDAARELK